MPYTLLFFYQSSLVYVNLLIKIGAELYTIPKPISLFNSFIHTSTFPQNWDNFRLQLYNLSVYAHKSAIAEKRGEKKIDISVQNED